VAGYDIEDEDDISTEAEVSVAGIVTLTLNNPRTPILLVVALPNNTNTNGTNGLVIAAASAGARSSRKKSIQIRYELVVKKIR
jgi:hypothetical protein